MAVRSALCMHTSHICELRKNDFLEEWLEDVHNAVKQPDNIPLANQRERDASNIRDALAVFFMTPEGRTLVSGSE